MSDLIDRQDAIDVVANWFKKIELNGDICLDGLRSLLSAEKTGKWVNNINDMPICNQCGYMTPYDRAIDDYEYGNFCPNCGAKMEDD